MKTETNTESTEKFTITRLGALIRAHQFRKCNIFQLAKRVRRATTKGRQARAVLNRKQVVESPSSMLRSRVAYQILLAAEKQLRQARTYCAYHNVPTSDGAFVL